MPIHTSWKSMANSMKKQYKEGKVTCRPFTDGSKVCASKRAWSLFYATVTKLVGRGGETKSRSKKINETVFQETVGEVIQDLINWRIKDKELS